MDVLAIVVMFVLSVALGVGGTLAVFGVVFSLMTRARRPLAGMPREESAAPVTQVPAQAA